MSTLGLHVKASAVSMQLAVAFDLTTLRCAQSGHPAHSDFVTDGASEFNGNSYENC